MLKRDKLDQRDFTFAKLIQQNAQSLLSRVNEILDLTKLKSNKMELKEEKIVVYPFLKIITANFESLTDLEQIHLQFKYQADQYLQIELDKNKFEKIVQNLLANAIKFTPKNGKISIDFEDKASHLLLTVADTGRGIASEDLPHIFDAYYQSTLPNAPAEGGTGIGLALCKEFADLMSGELRVTSKPNEGSIFSFTFPKKEVLGKVDTRLKMTATQTEDLLPPIVTKPLTEKEKPITESKAASILIVEDNHSLRNYIQTLLAPSYLIKTAQNGQAAWDFLNNEAAKPDLILSDIMMPEMDGYQLLEKLKNSLEFNRIPIIMLTARAAFEDRLKALQIGVDDYLTKPFEEEELLARIENLLKHSLWRQQYQQEIVVESEIEQEVETLTQDTSLISEKDQQWLDDLKEKMKSQLNNFNYSIDQLASELFTNRWSIYRRLKQLTGLTPTQYLQEIRLYQALQLLENKEVDSIKALSLSVGMKDVKYFSKQFKKRYGKLPSAYLN